MELEHHRLLHLSHSVLAYSSAINGKFHEPIIWLGFVAYHYERIQVQSG